MVISESAYRYFRSPKDQEGQVHRQITPTEEELLPFEEYGVFAALEKAGREISERFSDLQLVQPYYADGSIKVGIRWDFQDGEKFPDGSFERSVHTIEVQRSPDGKFTIPIYHGAFTIHNGQADPIETSMQSAIFFAKKTRQYIHG